MYFPDDLLRLSASCCFPGGMLPSEPYCHHPMWESPYCCPDGMPHWLASYCFPDGTLHWLGLYCFPGGTMRLSASCRFPGDWQNCSPQCFPDERQMSIRMTFPDGLLP